MSEREGFFVSPSMVNLSDEVGNREMLAQLATRRWHPKERESVETVGRGLRRGGGGASGMGAARSGLIGSRGSGSEDGEGSEPGGGARGGESGARGGEMGSSAFILGAEMMAQGAAAVVDDSFSRCFERAEDVAWNFNLYLLPVWAVGVVVRYALLFPIRALILLLGAFVFFVSFFAVKLVGPVALPGETQVSVERWLLQMLAQVFVMSWSGVVLLHGVRPTASAGEFPGIFLANHTSMADFIVMLASHPYAVLGQLHDGWVGWMQRHALMSLDCIWFDRGSMSNRKLVADRIRAHATDHTKPPLLIFGEGTCVNNQYMLRLRKNPFELGVPINPVAIHYHRDWSDPYWISRHESFGRYLVRLMCSWAVVVDVTFLEPMHIRPGEKPEDFAQRVQVRIAKAAGLKAVSWDGYMKYWRPSQRFVQMRQKACAEELLQALQLGPPDAKPPGYTADEQHPPDK